MLRVAEVLRLALEELQCGFQGERILEESGSG